MDKCKTLILRDEDVYLTSNGEMPYGGSKKMYEAHVVIRLHRNGTFKVLKDRFGLSEYQIMNLINPVNKKLLLV